MCHIDLSITSTTCFTTDVRLSLSIERMTALYPLHFSECNSRCFVQKLRPHIAQSRTQSQPHVLHFAGSVLSIAGFVVMRLLV